MNTQDAQAWMARFNDKIQANKDYLSQLDTPIGDGDHGGNMARGMAAVMAELTSKNPASPAEVFKIVSMQLLSKVGGASGPLYGSAFMGLSKGLTAGDSLVDSLQAGLDLIQKRGKAQLGEKTMIDVWVPVLDSLQANALTQTVIETAVASTKDIQATKGRASYVGERAIGHLDPGAYSSGLLFSALLEVTSS